VAMRSSGEAFPAEFPMARVAYVIEKDLSTLDAALDGLLGEDPLAESRRAYRRHCLGDRLGSHAADELLRVAGEPVTSPKGRGDAVTRTPRTPAPELSEGLGPRPELEELLASEAVARPPARQVGSSGVA